MKKYIRYIMPIAISALILAGCGADKGDDAASSDLPEQTSEEETEEEIEAGDAKVTDEEESDVSTEEFEMIPETDASASYYGDVPLNNGGHFVRKEDIVYFHVPDEEGMKVTGLFGNFIDSENGSTELAAFHVDTMDVDKVISDHSYGGIGIAGSTMYMNQFAFTDGGPTDELGVYDMANGFASSNVEAELYFGASKDGSTVVTGIFDGDQEGYILHVHRSDGSEYTVEDGRINPWVVCDNERVFYSTYDYNTNEYKLFEYSYADGRKLFLGDIPTPTYEGATEGPGQIKDAVIEGTGVFFSVNYYEGSGNFLNQSFLVSAFAGDEGSLTYEEWVVHDDESAGVEPAFRVVGGKIETDVDGIPLTAGVTEDGDLVYYNENGKQEKIENITPGAYGTVTDEEGNIQSMTECVEYLDGEIFGIRNELERVPEEDIGWRMAYRRTKTTFFVVYTDVGDEREIYTVESGSSSSASAEEGDIVDTIDISSSAGKKTDEGIFTSEPIPDSVFARMNGVSFPANCTISRDDLRYLRLSYHDFNGNTQLGELVCNKKVADDMIEIFRELYRRGYQIEKMKLIDDYGGDDDLSCADNNTSCFNYRTVAGSTNLSKHALGVAVDINPFYNPYVTYPNGVEHISPPGSEPYADRSADFPHKIGPGDDAYELFKSHGFTWGGNWKTLKDYQHFQKG